MSCKCEFHGGGAGDFAADSYRAQQSLIRVSLRLDLTFYAGLNLLHQISSVDTARRLIAKLKRTEHQARAARKYSETEEVTVTLPISRAGGAAKVRSMTSLFSWKRKWSPCMLCYKMSTCEKPEPEISAQHCYTSSFLEGKVARL